MANYNDRNRNRGSYNQDWDNDDYRNMQSSEFENERRRYGSQSQDRGNYGGSFENDRSRGETGRYQGDSDYGSGQGMYGGNPGMYGNQGGMNRGSNYSSRGEDDWKYRGTIGPEERGSRERFGSERHRNDDRGWWDKTRDEVSSWFGDDDAERRRHMDETQSRYKGKGPKGYTRSDERIKEDVNDRLSDDNYVDASEIDVTVNNGEVTLSGTVHTRNEKRRAEDVVEAISGVKNVENRIKVNTASNMGNTGSGSMGSNYGQTGSSTAASTSFESNRKKM